MSEAPDDGAERASEAVANATARYVPEASAPEGSDEALALHFSKLHAGDLRYVAMWGKWLHWQSTHWQTDATLKAFDFSREVCREAAEAVPERKKRFLFWTWTEAAVPAEKPNEPLVVLTATEALKAVAEWHRKRPEADVKA